MRLVHENEFESGCLPILSELLRAHAAGNSDSSNGCNLIYDEMIDELTDSDGSNRTEYWKQILLKREYVYNKPITVRGGDGVETMRTMKLKTPHQETHCVW